MAPEAKLTALDKSTLGSLPANYLFDEVLARLANAPARWHMAVTIAQPGDPIDNATVQWPNDRVTVDVGTLTVMHATEEERGACRDITFDPTLLPAGVTLSDDPLLPARSAAYATSFRLRAEHGPEHSAIGEAVAAHSTRAN
jgi:catalase